MINAVNIMPTPFIPSSDTIVEHNAHYPETPDDSDSNNTSPTTNTSSSSHKPFGTPYIPPTHTSTKSICIKSLQTDTIHPPPPIIYDRDITTAIRGQLDTGADLTCTNLIEILHDYKSYSKSFPCRIKLVGAIDSTDGVYPHGEGYIHVPADSHLGFIRIRCVYSPHLSSTLISEDDIIRSNPYLKLKEYTTAIYKYHDAGSVSIICTNHKKPSLTVAIHGILSHGKSYTQPLHMPNLPAHRPRATIYNSFDKALQEDKTFAKHCQSATIDQIQLYQDRAQTHVREALTNLPTEFAELPFDDWMFEATPVLAIKANTERLLWHQRLGHINDDYLYTAHKFVDGVPKFKHHDPILDQCPTCIQSKQTKTPAGPNSTRKATRPYQGLSIDFSFSGVRSKNKSRRTDYEGANGETSWILISDHFTRHLIGDTRLSKASPIHWLRNFLDIHAPKCPDKYVCMDQGGKLYHNPAVRKLFQQKGYTIRPTGADASHQNGPVERSHRTVADRIRCLLSGANLPIKFWPYAFHHSLRILNAIPGRGQEKSPIELATGKRENLKNFKTFGARVWIRPPGRRNAKFRNNARKGIFLGFVPDTTRNIIWYDVETNRTKIASHARFDEGMNDLPTSELPPNVVHLQRSENNIAMPAETKETSIDDFFFYVSPFEKLITTKLTVQCDSPTFGLLIKNDDINGRAFLHEIEKKTSASNIFSSHKATRNKIRGSYIISIDGRDVFDKSHAMDIINTLHNEHRKEFTIVFAPEEKLTSKQKWKDLDEFNLFSPTPSTDEASIDYLTIRAITTARTGLDCSENEITDDMIRLVINAIGCNTTTAAEEAMGHLTRRKLRKLDNWDEWLTAERKQLNQFHELDMYGQATKLPPKGILLRPHWQYVIRKTGERRSRNCCDGSKRAAPLLHAIASTYSSCVEQPIQRLFLALSGLLEHKLYAGDAKDAYAHSPAPETPTFVSIDGPYADWYKWKFGKTIDTNHVLPVQHALQGHPESGRLWEEHINKILGCDELKFKSTTHDRCIYQTTYNDTKILMLRQVDDFLISSPNQELATEIYKIIGEKLQLPNEPEIPFKDLGFATSYNGVDVKQTKHYTEITCEDYIDRISRTHGWETATNTEITSKPTAPIPDKALDHVFNNEGPAEHTTEHKRLETKHGFVFRGLLGKILYAYNVCRPDIGYAVGLLSKFSTFPTNLHYNYLKSVALYLRRTKTWGLRFKKPPNCPHDDLPDGTFDDEPIKLSDTLPTFPELPSDATITCFVDAAYGNDRHRRKSTTGFAIMLANAAIVYKSKSQTQTALSSTEAEFYAAVSAAKIILYLRSIMLELGFPQHEPTIVYEDNESTIKIVNSGIVTERSRHIDIQYFAIQDWKRQKHIAMKFIAGSINCADALTKPLGWVLHNRHARRLMGHFH